MNREVFTQMSLACDPWIASLEAKADPATGCAYEADVVAITMRIALQIISLVTFNKPLSFEPTEPEGMTKAFHKLAHPDKGMENKRPDFDVALDGLIRFNMVKMAAPRVSCMT